MCIRFKKDAVNQSMCNIRFLSADSCAITAMTYEFSNK